MKKYFNRCQIDDQYVSYLFICFIELNRNMYNGSSWSYDDLNNENKKSRLDNSSMKRENSSSSTHTHVHHHHIHHHLVLDDQTPSNSTNDSNSNSNISNNQKKRKHCETINLKTTNSFE